MDEVEKLCQSAQAGLWEADGDPRPSLAPTTCGGGRGPKETWVDVGGASIPVTYAAAGGGRTVRLLKAMLTTACERDCLYCSFRAGRDCRRVSFRPDQMAKIYMQVHGARLAEGLFLSTGMLRGGPSTQDRLIDTAEILRHRLGYRGYLHLKIMPGAERDQVWRSMQLADRVSVNLEAPNASRLERLAPHKTFEAELVTPLRWVEELRRDMPQRLGWRGRMPSSASQFVVGPAGESDLEILSVSERLLRSLKLARVYFMAFNPVEGTPLEGHPAENPLREHRLYQASYLIRDYGFDLEDLPFSEGGRLPIDQDPKRAYAEAHLREKPLDLQHAGREELLRVPGIGPRGAEAILRARRGAAPLRDLSDLRRMGILAERAAPYVLLNGRAPGQQLRMF